MNALETTSTKAITICVLAYNRPEGLKKTVETFLDQDYAPITILIGDDASPNPAVEEVGRKLEQNHSNVFYFRNAENLGIVGNHKALLAKVKTPYMAWACDDDHWTLDYVSTCMQAFEEHPHIVWSGTLSLMHDQVRPKDFEGFSEYVHTLGIRSPVERFRHIFPEILYWNNSFYGVFKTKIAQSLPLKKRFAFDYFFVLKAAALGEFHQSTRIKFFKKVGGIGNEISSNLKAIGVDQKKVKHPSLSIFWGLLSILWVHFPGHILGKLKASIAVAAYLLNNTPFIGRKDLHYFLAAASSLSYQILYRLSHTWLPWGFIKNLNSQQLNEIKGCNKKDGYFLFLKKIGVPLKASKENMDLIHQSRFLVRLQTELGLHYSAAPEGGLIAHLHGLKLPLKTAVDLFILEEVYGHQTYGVDLPENSILLDVGMNIGFTSLFFASHERVKKIHAFEPLELARERAQENFALNPKYRSKIKAWPFGLALAAETQKTSIQPSAMVVFNPKNEGLQKIARGVEWNSTHEAVESEVALEDWRKVLPPILEEHQQDALILKMDCEGFEEVLIPSWQEAGLLPQFHSIVLEWHESPQNMVKILRESGFKLVCTRNPVNPGFVDTGMIYAHR